MKESEQLLNIDQPPDSAERTFIVAEQLHNHLRMIVFQVLVDLFDFASPIPFKLDFRPLHQQLITDNDFPPPRITSYQLLEKYTAAREGCRRRLHL